MPGSSFITQLNFCRFIYYVLKRVKDKRARSALPNLHIALRRARSAPPKDGSRALLTTKERALAPGSDPARQCAQLRNLKAATEKEIIRVSFDYFKVIN